MLTKDIAAALGASLIGDGAKDIARIVHPDDAEYASDLAVAISSIWPRVLLPESSAERWLGIPAIPMPPVEFRSRR